MSERFIEWKEARNHAVSLARKLNMPVAIRRVKEYGKQGYNVSLADTKDLDRAEIVWPSDAL